MSAALPGSFVCGTAPWWQTFVAQNAGKAVGSVTAKVAIECLQPLQPHDDLSKPLLMPPAEASTATTTATRTCGPSHRSRLLRLLSEL